MNSSFKSRVHGFKYEFKYNNYYNMCSIMVNEQMQILANPFATVTNPEL